MRTQISGFMNNDERVLPVGRFGSQEMSISGCDLAMAAALNSGEAYIFDESFNTDASANANVYIKNDHQSKCLVIHSLRLIPAVAVASWPAGNTYFILNYDVTGTPSSTAAVNINRYSDGQRVINCPATIYRGSPMGGITIGGARRHLIMQGASNEDIVRGFWPLLAPGQAASLNNGGVASCNCFFCGIIFFVNPSDVIAKG